MKDQPDNILQRIKDFFSTQPALRELIGRSTYVISDFWSRMVSNKQSIDETRTDYPFWDRFRHGKAKGYEIAGAFAKPITQVLASWVLGSRVTARVDSGDAYTNNMLHRFLRRIHGQLIKFLEDLYALGDMYMIVNPDGSLSMPSPETVDVEYDPLDYRRPIRFRITTKLTKATVVDEYTAKERILIIKWSDKDKPEQVKRYQNLIGRIPVIHFPNDRSGNEIFGRPIYEALLRVFGRYDNLTEKALDGAELLGNPMPTFEGLEDIDETISANADSSLTEYDPETGAEKKFLNWGALTALFVGKGGKFDFKSPRQNFTGDIREMLKLLFLLILEFTRIPEAVWGGELTSSRSTAVEQMKTFFNYIRSRRIALEGTGSDEVLGAEARGGLLELIDVWLRMKALTDPKVKVGDVTMYWEPLSDIPYDIKLKMVQWSYSMGMISSTTALRNLELIDYANGDEQVAMEQERLAQDPYEVALNADLQSADAESNDFEREQRLQRQRMSA